MLEDLIQSVESEYRALEAKKTAEKEEMMLAAKLWAVHTRLVPRLIEIYGEEGAKAFRGLIQNPITLALVSSPNEVTLTLFDLEERIAGFKVLVKTHEIRIIPPDRGSFTLDEGNKYQFVSMLKDRKEGFLGWFPEFIKSYYKEPYSVLSTFTDEQRDEAKKALGLFSQKFPHQAQWFSDQYQRRAEVLRRESERRRQEEAQEAHYAEVLADYEERLGVWASEYAEGVKELSAVVDLIQKEESRFPYHLYSICIGNTEDETRESFYSLSDEPDPEGYYPVVMYGKIKRYRFSGAYIRIEDLGEKIPGEGVEGVAAHSFGVVDNGVFYGWGEFRVYTNPGRPRPVINVPEVRGEPPAPSELNYHDVDRVQKKVRESVMGSPQEESLPF